ncbi:MAG: hypothetical protein P8L85_10540 [Rubripirellula sp.]|nr:hypothetical protein [Rubripirellula sp.]
MNCSHSDRRDGLTLVEVVVGLVLMATVLVSSLLATGAHRRQHHFSNNKLVAVGIADDLLNQFLNSRDGIPPVAQGLIAARPQWSWRTQVVGAAAPAGVPMQVIRLEILGELGKPYASVEVVKKIQN